MSKITAYELVSLFENKDVFLIDGPGGTRIIEADVLAPLIMQMGIGGEAYTKEQVNAIFANRYTKDEVSDMLSQRYTKGEVDDLLANRYTKGEVTSLLASRPNKSSVDTLITNITSKIPNSYTKTESDNKFALKTTVANQATTISNLQTTASNVSTAASNASTAASNASNAAANAQTAANNAKAKMEGQVASGTFVPAYSTYAVLRVAATTGYGSFRVSVDIFFSSSYFVTMVGDVIIQGSKCWLNIRAFEMSSTNHFSKWYSGKDSNGYPIIGFTSGVQNGNFSWKVTTDKSKLASDNAIDIFAPNSSIGGVLPSATYQSRRYELSATYGFDPAQAYWAN